MKNKVAEDIKKYAIERLKREYGYCGCAEGDASAMLNSGNNGVDLAIVIKVKSDSDDLQ